MNNLMEIRKRLGMSKWRLARQTGLNWKTVHRIEQGEHVPFESSKERLAQVLGVTVEEIFPPTDVEHIFLTEPRRVYKQKTAAKTPGQIIGYLLDRNLRRCGGIEVRLVSGRKRIAKTKSEEDGRFIFDKLPKGEYMIEAGELVVKIDI